MSLVGAFVAAALSTAFASVGNPSLRHDWFPIVPGFRLSLDTVSGWNPVGLGAPAGYPASFTFVPLFGMLAALFDSYVAHVFFMLVVAVVTAFGARRLAWRIGAPITTQIAAAFFALFNPWFYTKLVAGHGFMLIAYGATYWLVAECLARRPSARVLAFSALLVAPQIQFVILDAPIFALLAFRSRDLRPLGIVAASLLPVVVGIWTTRSSLVGIPLTTQWEIGQSVDPFAATFLRGYFTLYDAKLDPFLSPVLWVVVILATIGAIDVVVRGHRMRWIVAATTAMLLISFGLRGPLAGPFSYAIGHVSEVGLFRELYGLLGYVAVGYCALCCIATVRFRFAAAVFACATASLAAVWFVYPPSRYWVDGAGLPQPDVARLAHARIALVPAVAPLGLGSRGSGVDPDGHPYRDDVVPINDASPQFPISSALGDYLLTGSTRRLAALSVEKILVRPWLQTDVTSLGGQLAFAPRPSEFATRGASASVEDALPELTLSPPPRVGTLASTQGAGNILFADAARVAGDARVPSSWKAYSPVTSVHASNRFVHASDDWVDARFGFLEQPELGQAFGGALTTGRATLLAVSGDRDTLVWIRGRLAAQSGRVVSTTTRGYLWLHMPPGVRAVRCEGECVIAAQAEVPKSLPLEPAAQPFSSVPFRTLTPWLIVADVPPGAAQLLRYNVRYDDGWTAGMGAVPFVHVRIDTAVNGWLLPPRSHSIRLAIVERGAAAVAFSELLALIIEAALLLAIFRSRTKASVDYALTATKR